MNVLDLPARVAALEQRLAAPETQPAPPTADQLQPNVLTVNPDGTIGANLTGHLAAQGVDLSVAPSSPTSNQQVRWLDTTSRLPRAVTYATYDGSDRSTLAQELQDGSNAANILGYLVLDHYNSSGKSTVFVGAGNKQTVLLGSNGASSFLQLTGNSKSALSQIYAIPFNLAAGAGLTASVTPTDFTFSNWSSWLPFGAIYNTGNATFCQWTYGGLSGNTLTVYVRNLSSTLTATGTLYLQFLGRT